MRRVIWSDEAVRNIENIAAYIADFNPLAAQRIAAKLITAGDSLAEFSHRGRNRADGTRELVAVWPYLIRYDVGFEAVEIVSVRHGAQAPE